MSFLKDFKDLKKDISLATQENNTENKMTNPQEIRNENSTPAKEDERSYDLNEKAYKDEEKNMANIVNEIKNDVDNEVTVIAEGTTIQGNMESEKSISIYGTVYGNVNCKNKLIVAGRVSGDLKAGEIFINKAAVDGEVNCEGNLKIGNGSIIIGNVFGQTAVIGGAIKGEIDVQGPVIIDSSAVIKGNIKSQSVQINNGAVIDGYCSQCYHEVDVNAIFSETFKEENTEETQEVTDVPDMMGDASVESTPLQEDTEASVTEEFPADIPADFDLEGMLNMQAENEEN